MYHCLPLLKKYENSESADIGYTLTISAVVKDRTSQNLLKRFQPNLDKCDISPIKCAKHVKENYGPMGLYAFNTRTSVLVF